MPATLPFPCGSSALPGMVTAELACNGRLWLCIASNLTNAFIKGAYLQQDAAKALHKLSYCHEAHCLLAHALGNAT